MRKRSLFITLLSVFLTLCFCLGALTACGENTSSEPIELPPEETPKPPVVITPDDSDYSFDPKDDYDARMSKLRQEWDAKEIIDYEFYLSFTAEYTVKTLYHDYVPEDFERVNVSRVIDADLDGTVWLRKKLAGEPVNDYGTFNYSNYKRGFFIYLEEPSRENVYEAVVGLSFKEGVLHVSPFSKGESNVLLNTEVEDPYAPVQWGLEKIEE